MSETFLQSDKKTDENKKQKEFENKSKNAANAENNEAQNQILDSSNLINSESKSASNIKDNKIDENTDKVEYKENTIINNEIPLKNIEKSDQSMLETQKLQSENNDARYYSFKISYRKLILSIFNNNLAKHFHYSTIKF